MNSNKGTVTAAATLGFAIIIAATIGAYVFYRVHTLDNTLTVTGSAMKDMKADAAKWTVTVNRVAYEGTIPAMQERVTADSKVVSDFLTAAGIAVDKVDISPVFVDQNYSNDQNVPRTYNVREDITVQSNKPELIARLSKDISALSNKGILFSPGQPQYFVTTLPQVRVSLIGAAVSDARARAAEIASSTGQSVGALKSASSGVVQVMAPNSVDVTDYGSDDTSTIDKQVMVTARAVFYLH